MSKRIKYFIKPLKVIEAKEIIEDYDISKNKS
jgi:hypothetical protein